MRGEPISPTSNLPPLLSHSTRDVTFSSPVEISSQSTCEYAANRRPNQFLSSDHSELSSSRNRKIRSPKSRRKSCAPCALAKCKCDLQQPCSCCIAKRRECTFADTMSVTAVKVTPAGVSETECTVAPSTSSNIIFTPDTLAPSGLKSCAVEKRLGDHYPLDLSPGTHLADPPDLVFADQSWLGDAGQFGDQLNSSCLQDIFFDWNVPPGCSPLDFTSTFSPIYASTETTPFGIISDSAHIMTPSAYLEPENTQQSTGELKRYCMFPISCPSTFRLDLPPDPSRNCDEDVYRLPPCATLYVAERWKVASPSDGYACLRSIPRKIPRSAGTCTVCHRRHDTSVNSRNRE